MQAQTALIVVLDKSEIPANHTFKLGIKMTPKASLCTKMEYFAQNIRHNV